MAVWDGAMERLALSTGYVMDSTMAVWDGAMEPGR